MKYLCMMVVVFTANLATADQAYRLPQDSTVRLMIDENLEAKSYYLTVREEIETDTGRITERGELTFTKEDVAKGLEVRDNTHFAGTGIDVAMILSGLGIPGAIAVKILIRTVREGAVVVSNTVKAIAAGSGLGVYPYGLIGLTGTDERYEPDDADLERFCEGASVSDFNLAQFSWEEADGRGKQTFLCGAIWSLVWQEANRTEMPLSP